MKIDKPDKILNEFNRVFSHSAHNKAYLVRKSGICYSTFRNWETGKTLSPKISTMRMALSSLGYKIVIEKKE